MSFAVGRAPDRSTVGAAASAPFAVGGAASYFTTGESCAASVSATGAFSTISTSTSTWPGVCDVGPIGAGLYAFGATMSATFAFGAETGFLPLENPVPPCLKRLHYHWGILSDRYFHKYLAGSFYRLRCTLVPFAVVTVTGYCTAGEMYAKGVVAITGEFAAIMVPAGAWPKQCQVGSMGVGLAVAGAACIRRLLQVQKRVVYRWRIMCHPVFPQVALPMEHSR